MRNDHIRLQNTPTPFATPAGFTDLFVEDGVLMVQTHDGASEVVAVSTTGDGNISGALTMTGLTVNGNATVTGTLTVGGQTELASGQTAATGNSAMSRELVMMERIYNAFAVAPARHANNVYTSSGGSAVTNGNMGLTVNASSTVGARVRTSIGAFRANSGGGVSYAQDLWAAFQISTMYAASLTSDSVFRFRIGFNAPTTEEPFADSDPLAANSLGVGAEFQRNPVNDKMRVRLFARDGTSAVAGTLITSSWVDLTGYTNAVDFNKCASLILRHNGPLARVELFFEAYGTNAATVRNSTTPLLTLSGAGVPTTTSPTTTVKEPLLTIAAASPAAGAHGWFAGIAQCVIKQ